MEGATVPEIRRLKKQLHDKYGLSFVPDGAISGEAAPEIEEKYNFLASTYEYIPSSGKFRRYGSGKEPLLGQVTANGYRAIGTFWKKAGKVVSAPAHRLAWFCHYGEVPAGHVDHIDNNRENNCIGNLRVVTHAQNMRNRKDSTDAPGVRRVGKTSKFKASIHHNGETKRLGVFDDMGSAIRARKQAEKMVDTGEWDKVEDFEPATHAKSGNVGVRMKGDRHRVILGCTRREQRNGMKANVHIGMYSDRETALLARDICYKLREMGCNPKTGEPLLFD